MTGLDNAPVTPVARPFMRPGGRRLLAGLLAALLVLLVALRQSVLTGLGESLVVSDPLEHADLIYVLAGDFWGSRVLLGARLGSEGWAPKVLIGGGLYEHHWTGEMSVDFAVMHGYPRSLFVPVNMQAKATIDEARVMGPVFRRLGAHRILLVTSNFHSRRAEEVFKLYLPEFEFRMEGAPEDVYDPRGWWKNPRQRKLWLSEYQKMMGTLLVRFHLARANWLRKVGNDVP